MIANLIQPSAAVESWEALTRRRRVVVSAGADAHAKLALRGPEPVNGRYALPLPDYESTFRVLSVHVRTDRPLSGNPGQDATAIMRAIRGGHLYYAVDGVASPPAFEFTATNSRGTVREGDELGPGGPVVLHVRSNAPPEFTTIVHEGTQTLTTVRDAQDITVHGQEKPAVYWVEIISPGSAHPVTWLRSNPIYVRAPTALENAPVATTCQELAAALRWPDEGALERRDRCDIARRVRDRATRRRLRASNAVRALRRRCSRDSSPRSSTRRRTGSRPTID